MRAVRAICETIHLGALGVWAGTVVMTGVTAALAFPTMRDLDPMLPGFEAYPHDHWVIAAGSVMNRAFLVSDWIGVACAVAAAATLGVVLGLVRFARPATVLRTIALAGAIGVAAYTLAVLRPDMQRELHAFWDAAQAGRLGEAEAHRAAFDEMHPTASFFIVTQLVLVLWALGAGGFAALMDTGMAGVEGEGGEA